MNLEDNSCRNHESLSKNDRNHEYQNSNDSASTSETSEELFAISVEPACKNFICSVSKAR